MKRLFFTTVLVLSALGSGLGVYNLTHLGAAQQPTVGAFNPTGGSTYTIKSSVGSTATSIVLSSFTEPGSNIPYTMAYLNSDIEYGTLAPQTTNNEFISFTGIVQNSDGSATLTGVVRGLERSYPYAASTTLAYAHPGQSQFILGNTPQFYNEFAKRRSNEWITGTWGFAALPTTTVVCSNQYQLCNKAYIDAVTVAGAPAAGYVIPGIGIIATQLQAASSTASTTYNTVQYPNFLSANIATDTPNTATRASRVLLSDLTGYLKQGWINLTQAFTFSGLNTFAAGFLATASSTVNAGNLHIGGATNNVVPSPYFGGTGVDGALAISSGTTTIDTKGAAVVEKNYSSISITGTGSLSFTGTTTASLKTGTTIILRSQGACTITSSSMVAIHLRYLGGGPGNANTALLQSGATLAGGSGGGSGSGPGGLGDSFNNNGNPLSVAGSPGPATISLATTSRLVIPGGNGSSNSTSKAGLGGGGLYLECAGALTFTTGGILGTGENGVAGSGTQSGAGAGAGGNVLMMAGSIVSKTGTITLTGGTGGGAGNSGYGAGAVGADGTSLIVANSAFY